MICLNLLLLIPIISRQQMYIVSVGLVFYKSKDPVVYTVSIKNVI